jgi:hypothetical protein
MSGSNLVKSLIAIKQQRDIKTAKDRAEERQAKLDAERLEQQAFENQQAVAEAQRAAEQHKADQVKAKTEADQIKYGLEQEKWRREGEKAEEDLLRKANEDSVKHRAAMEKAYLDLLKTSVGTETSPGSPEAKKAAKELRSQLDLLPVMPKQEKPMVADAALLSGVGPKQEELSAPLDPLATGGMIGDTYMPFQGRADELAQIAQKSALSPQVISAQIRAAGGTKPTFQKFDNDLYRVTPDGGLKLVMKGTGEETKKTQVSEKTALELAGYHSLAKEVANLKPMASGYKFNIAKWTPDFIKGMMSEETNSKFFTDALQYEPAYFMFAAKMLKLMQGSRPSDRDMEWYIENLPKLTDPPEIKAEKIRRLSNQLASDYDAKVSFLTATGRDTSKFPELRIEIPDFGSSELPPGATLD